MSFSLSSLKSIHQLFSQELNKHTPEGHIDKPNFQSALTAMQVNFASIFLSIFSNCGFSPDVELLIVYAFLQEISQYVNEVKRDSEELIKINQIETRLSEYDAVNIYYFKTVFSVLD